MKKYSSTNGVTAAVLAVMIGGCGGDDNAPSVESASPPPVSLPDEVPATTPVAFVNVTVIPMSSDVELSGYTVVVRDGLIEELGSSGSVNIPNESVIIDGENHFLMPGIADMHIHPLCSAEDGTCYLGEREMQVYLAHGVTTVLSLQDTGGTFRNVVKEGLSDPIAKGEMAGPTVYMASFAGGPEDLKGIADASQVVVTHEDGLRHVAESKAQGYDFIKVYDGVSNEAFAGIVAQANVDNMGVIGHFPRVDAVEALTDGLDMVAHAGAYLRRYFNFSLEADLIAGATDITVSNQVYVNTTLGLAKKQVTLACANEQAFEAMLTRPEIRYANAIELGIWRAYLHSITHFPGCTTALVADRYAFVQQYVKAFYDGGVKLVLGTDSPLVWSVPGFSALEELQVIAELGLSPFETLEIATRNAGEFVDDFLPGAESFGTIEPGKRADLLLVEKNPLTDLNNVTLQAGVMARGRWFSAGNLKLRLESVAADYADLQ